MKEMYKYKKIVAVLLCLCAAVLIFSSCKPGNEKKSRGFEAMDTYMNIDVYGANEALLDELEASIEELDGRLSVTSSGSEIYKLNKDGSAKISASTADLVRQTLKLCADTDGALDITIQPVVEEWGFISGDYKIPSEERLKSLAESVDYRMVSCGGSDISFEKKGMKAGFGAVAKGYAADEAVRLLKEKGCESAILNLGGTVAAYGKKPDGSKWKIGIADPENSASYIGYVSCSNKIAATSGSYERYFKGDDGKIYSHIIDPKTGRPVDNGILSVTIISDSGLLSDALSTALFVMGREAAEKYYSKNGGFDFIILTNDKKAFVTKTISDSFTVSEGEGYEKVIVE